MKNLMIVESPTKVKSIEKFLGPDFKVVASVGHVRDLVSSARKGIDVDKGFKPVWKVSNNKKSVIDDIKKYTKDADVIYFATDPDREGEAISKHLYDILEKAKFLKGKETHRVVFNEITKNAVVDALKNPRTISISQWDAYLARRTLDYLMGYDISEFLWKKVSRDARAGRVQSPALRLIVEREIKINAFDPQEYWNLSASVSNNDRNIEIELIEINGEKIKKDNITSINDSKSALLESFILVILSFFIFSPLISINSISMFLSLFETLADKFQYSCGSNAFILISRSTINLNAGL